MNSTTINPILMEHIMSGSPLIFPVSETVIATNPNEISLSITNSVPELSSFATENPFTCNTYSIAQPIGLIEKSKKSKTRHNSTVNPCNNDENDSKRIKSNLLGITKISEAADYIQEILSRLSSLEKFCNQLKNENKKLRQESNKSSKGKINNFWDTTQGQCDYGARLKQIEFDFTNKINDIEKNSLKISEDLDKSNVIVKRLLDSEVNLCK